MQKKLYAVRIGFNKFIIAVYQQIRDDVYKDIITDKNIVVRITQDKNGNYRITELISDDAKLNSYDHNFITPLYEDMSDAVINYCKKRIQESQREINEKNKRIANLEYTLKELEQNLEKNKLEIKTPKLTDFDFDDIIYLASVDNPTATILTFKIDKKVFIKDGSLIELQSENYQNNYCTECSRSIINGFCINKDMFYTDKNGHKYKAYKDFTSAKNSLEKIKIKLVKQEIKKCQYYIDFWNENIAIYNKAIKKRTKNDYSKNDYSKND